MLRISKSSRNALCRHAAQRMEGIKSRVSGVLATLQSHWKSWKGGIMEWHPASRQESINSTQQCIEKNQLVRWPF